MNMSEINPFDILSGKVVKTEYGEFWFKEAGNNMRRASVPIYENLHRDNNLPAVIWNNGMQYWYKNGKMYKDNLQ